MCISRISIWFLINYFLFSPIGSFFFWYVSVIFFSSIIETYLFYIVYTIFATWWSQCSNSNVSYWLPLILNCFFIFVILSYELPFSRYLPVAWLGGENFKSGGILNTLLHGVPEVSTSLSAFYVNFLSVSNFKDRKFNTSTSHYFQKL